ncbi:MAG: hypothetical protein JKY15_00880 [Deltaproteobacteria bacterium]|nr:hypothetical protein [Deltaproteobacteria bacterium]
MNRFFILALLLSIATAQADPLPCIVIHNDGNETNFLNAIANFSIPTCNDTELKSLNITNPDIINRQIVEEPDNFFILSGFRKFTGRYLFGNLSNQSLAQNFSQEVFKQANLEVPSFPAETTNPLGMQIGYASLIILSSILLHDVYLKPFRNQYPAGTGQNRHYFFALAHAIAIPLGLIQSTVPALLAYRQNQLIEDSKKRTDFSQLAKAQEQLTWTYLLLVSMPFEILTALFIFCESFYLSNPAVAEMGPIQTKGFCILNLGMIITWFTKGKLPDAELYSTLMWLNNMAMALQCFLWIPFAGIEFWLFLKPLVKR